MADYGEAPTQAELVEGHLRDIIATGVSQRVLADLINVPRSTLGDFLAHRHTPSDSTIERILTGLGI